MDKGVISHKVQSEIFKFLAGSSGKTNALAHVVKTTRHIDILLNKLLKITEYVV